MKIRTARTTTALIALAFVVAACGSKSTSSGTSSSSSSSESSSSSSNSSAADASTGAVSSSSASATAGTSGAATSPVAGTTAATGTTAPAASGAVGSAAGTLTIWGDDLSSPALKEAATEFGTENGIQVNVVDVSKDLQAQFVTASQAGNGPDLVLGANDWIGNLVQNGAIDPVTLTSAQKGQFNPLGIQGVTFNGQVYGIPFDVENIFLVRNTDLAPNAPTSMEDLVSTGQALVKSGKASQILALPQGQNGDPYHLYPLFTSAGGTLFGKAANGNYNPNDLQLSTPASLAAAKKIATLGEKGSNALNRSITDDNVLSVFTDKKSPYIVTGPWNVGAIKKAGIKYDISAIPPFTGGGQAKPFVGVQALFVATKGKNKQIAQEFAANYFGTEPVAEALYQAYGRPPALTAAYDKVSASDPDIAKEAKTAVGGDILPSIPQMQAVWTPWGIAEAAIIGGADPASTFQKANDTIKAAIAGSG